MTNDEKRIALKAACLQAAATLIAARDTGKDEINTGDCAKYAAELYNHVLVRLGQ